MLQFSVDMDKCIRCGECARDCFAEVIGLDGEGAPFVIPEREERCIECQHCLAVCPTGALSVFGLDPEAGRPLKDGMPDAERMETLIMGRRSVRHYRKEGADPTLIRHLLEVASHAPTAVNRRPVHFTVVDDPQAMDRLRETATAKALAHLHAGTIPPGLERIGDYLKQCSDGRDVIFRGAPHLLVASAPEDALSPMADCHIAMSYFDLLASAHGLGTVWDGIARAIITGVVPELRGLLGIPEGHMVACAMAFGLPAVRYHRTVQRLGAVIRRAAI